MRDRPQPPPTPVAPSEALSEEKQAVIAAARQHPELRHRERAWRMVDEEVASLSPSTVYRVLKEANLVCPWRRRAQRKRAGGEGHAARPAGGHRPAAPAGGRADVLLHRRPR